jgi:glycosyltransferase involved in cell wall biosynthesis
MADSGEKVRVLMIGPAADTLGGQARQAARLLEHLRREPLLSVEYLAVNPRLRRPFCYLQRIKYVRTVVTAIAYWMNLLIKTPRFDVLHIFSASYFSYLLCAVPPLLLGRLLGKKTLLNYRSGEAEDHLRHWRLTGVPTVKLADMIVVPSGYLVDVFAAFGISARSIFNIVELDRFQFRQRDQLAPVFLTTRLLEPLYNVGCVLRSFQLIQHRFPNARLTVGGEGWMRVELEQLARDLELKNTTFIGTVRFADMPALYNSADVYLTATDLDNMPGSVIECFASGLPVVSTDAGGVPYIVTHEQTGLLVSRNDHAAMAAAALRLIDDPHLASQIARQARKACEQYTWEAVRDAWIRVYLELARKSGPQSEHNPSSERVKQAL